MLFQLGATELNDWIPQTSVSPPTSAKKTAAPRRSARPVFRNHFRPEISAATADLNEVKRSEFPRAVLLDPVAEERETLGGLGDDRVDHLCDGRFEGLDRGLHVSERQLEIRDLLRLQPAPDLPLGRHRRRAVAATPDQVEERGRELERPGRAALARRPGTSAGWVSVGGSCSYSRS